MAETLIFHWRYSARLRIYLLEVELHFYGSPLLRMAEKRHLTTDCMDKNQGISAFIRVHPCNPWLSALAMAAENSGESFL
ncbi:hypothetical protein OH491_02990 [Termitidicoccus mucosus]|uniref:hypothetical protein n=1 Tax=Termitidicoccus mucosus TaxID=1184151 RepID=UPI0011AB2F77